MRPSRLMAAVAFFLATSPVVAWAQGAEHGAQGGGGGLFDINVGLSAWTLLVFGALVLVLGRYAWGPILAAVEAREQRIQEALDEAARRNDEAASLLEEHRQQLAEARRRASELLAEARAAGDRARKEMEERTRAEAHGIIERARSEIERERDAALGMLRNESVDLALAAASRLLQENLDQAKDRQMMERFLDEVTDGRRAQA
ncbi:MAG: F0F1 ATP synthase subunit B [Gemmatimonadota bacterium]|jgi:F-type H+-transporting ATPase subunit b